MYHAERVIKRGNEPSYIQSPYKYFAPDNIYDLNDASDLAIMERAIA